MQVQRDWTVLVYSGVSRDLQAPARQSLQELAQAHAGQDVAVAAQVAGNAGADRYLAGGGHLEPVEHLDADMSQSASLEDFLRWGMRMFPARHTAVVIGGHGAGFLGAVTDPGRQHMMRLPEMAQALQGTHADVLVLNACLMAQAEVADELAPRAGYLVAAQGAENGPGMPLGRWVERLPGASPAAAAQALVGACSPDRVQAPTALDCARAPGLEAAMDGLARAILAHPQDRAGLRQDLAQLPSFWPRPWDRPLTDLKDLSTLTASWSQDERLSEPVREAARATGSAVHGAVVAGAGLSAFTPTRPLADMGPMGARVRELYADLHLARATAWDEAMDWLATDHPPQKQ